ncbi:MAG: (2Fe-2S)-binding protein, partial [Dongiaceae bacterium]
RGYRVLRAWAGVRPLVKPTNWQPGNPLPRSHRVIDHTEGGLVGAITICGGSFTSHRSMAEDAGNHVCRHFGVNEPSRTAETPLRTMAAGNRGWRPGANYEHTETGRSFAQLLCECENVPCSAVEALVEGNDMRSLHDIRRRLRVGFGPCQGTFCGARLASMVASAGGDGHEELARFWGERLKGATLAAYGTNARQLMLSDLVHRETLGIELRDGVDARQDRS